MWINDILDNFAIFATSWFLVVILIYIPSSGSVLKDVGNVNLFTLKGKYINVYFTKRLYYI